jgi:NAD(P)-dependent dehydrogenase (short-subunit alcohol dehydrogenase family)
MKHGPIALIDRDMPVVFLAPKDSVYPKVLSNMQEVKARGGRIIAITYAPGGRTGSWQPWVAMGAAKAALEVLCRYFAVALARRGITVNAVSPGWIEDSVLNSLPEAVQNQVRSWHQGGWTPMGRLGTPADIGNGVALLCSEEAGWITGQLIAVDGGSSLMDAHLPLEIQQVLPRAAQA